jgi:hypothetical protein
LAYVDNKGENGRKSQFCKLLLLFESVYTVYCTAQKMYLFTRGVGAADPTTLHFLTQAKTKLNK